MSNRINRPRIRGAVCAATLAFMALLVGVARAEPVLLAFTYRSAGVCAPCDRARPVLMRMKLDFPIQFYYVEDPSHVGFASQWRVDRYPSFIFVDKTGARTRELARWTGSDRLEDRIRALFAQFRHEERLRPGVPVGPRPAAPGVMPPKPRPSLPPAPPRKLPPKPRTPQRQWGKSPRF